MHSEYKRNKKTLTLLLFVKCISILTFAPNQSFEALYTKFEYR